MKVLKVKKLDKILQVNLRFKKSGINFKNL